MPKKRPKTEETNAKATADSHTERVSADVPVVLAGAGLIEAKTATEDFIRSRIVAIRGFQVLLDRDLAVLYGVEVKNLNRQVKRNIERFPADFMFQLDREECSRCQIVTLNEGRGMTKSALAQFRSPLSLTASFMPHPAGHVPASSNSSKPMTGRPSSPAAERIDSSCSPEMSWGSRPPSLRMSCA